MSAKRLSLVIDEVGAAVLKVSWENNFSEQHNPGWAKVAYRRSSEPFGGRLVRSPSCGIL